MSYLEQLKDAQRSSHSSSMTLPVAGCQTLRQTLSQLLKLIDTLTDFPSGHRTLRSLETPITPRPQFAFAIALPRLTPDQAVPGVAHDP